MHDMRRNVWRKNWADSFFTLDRSMPCQWKRQKFEDTCRKCNSRRRVNQVSSKYWLNVGGLLIDMSTDPQSTYWLTCWPTCPVTSWLLVNWVLADMSTDQVYPLIVDRYLAKGCSNFTRSASFTKLSSLSFREFGCFGPNCPFNRYY